MVFSRPEMKIKNMPYRWNRHRERKGSMVRTRVVGHRYLCRLDNRPSVRMNAP